MKSTLAKRATDAGYELKLTWEPAHLPAAAAAPHRADDDAPGGAANSPAGVGQTLPDIVSPSRGQEMNGLPDEVVASALGRHLEQPRIVLSHVVAAAVLGEDARTVARDNGLGGSGSGV